MAVTIRLVNVEILSGVPGHRSPNDDGASVHLEIYGDNSPVTLSYLNSPVSFS